MIKKNIVFDNMKKNTIKKVNKKIFYFLSAIIVNADNFLSMMDGLMYFYLWYRTNIIKIFSKFLVNAIKCYQCNSVTDPGCDKIEMLPKEAIAHFFKDCEGDFDGNEPFCRKQDIKSNFKTYVLSIWISFYIRNFFFLVISPKSTRVIRSCGWIKATHTNCLSLDSSFSKGGVCQCFEDGCNRLVFYFITIFKLLSICFFSVDFGYHLSAYLHY